MARDPNFAVPGDRPVQTPRSRQRQIFRATALEHYRENLDRIVLPRFTTPRVLGYLWTIAVFFMIAGFALAYRALAPGGWNLP